MRSCRILFFAIETMENLKDMLKDLAQKDLIGDLEIDLDLLNNN